MQSLRLCISSEFQMMPVHGPHFCIRVKSALALNFIKTSLKLVLFTVFVKIKPVSFLFGAGVYKGVK